MKLPKGKSLFVIQPAEKKLWPIISECHSTEPEKTRAARLLPRSARAKFCINKIGISLLTNRDFPIANVNTFLYLCSTKGKIYIKFNPLNITDYGNNKVY